MLALCPGEPPFLASFQAQPTSTGHTALYTCRGEFHAEPPKLVSVLRALGLCFEPPGLPSAS